MPGCNIRTVGAFYAAFQKQLNAVSTVLVCAPLGVNGPIVTDAIDCPGRDYLSGLLPIPEQALMELNAFRYRRQYRDLRYQYYILRTRRIEGDLERRLGPFQCGWRPGQGAFLASTDFSAAAEGDTTTARIKIDPNPAVWQALTETIRRGLAVGTQLVCLVPPQPPRFDRVIESPTETWDSFLSELSRTCRQEGVLLLDQHQLAEFGDESFFDHTHLKNDAARRYSVILGQELAKLGL
ncbi:MAG: hypothetical protein AB7U20_04035 [Planctomycetaceae bacterium]